MRPSYSTWKWKSNPRYPSPASARKEILTACLGMSVATMCPALSVHLAAHGHSRAYCGWGGHSLLYSALTVVACWFAGDFYEFYYHRLGHTVPLFWKFHKSHHRFANPTPFAVIADEYVDQFMRSLPLIIFPLLAPVNIDMLFILFGLHFCKWVELACRPPRDRCCQMPMVPYCIVGSSYRSWTHTIPGSTRRSSITSTTRKPP